MQGPLSLRRARSLASPRRLIIGSLLGSAALAGAVLGVLANGDGMSGWDWTVITAAVAAFGIVIVDSVLEFRASRRERELVVNLIGSGTERAAIERWNCHPYVRGTLDVYALGGAARSHIGSFGIRYGQVIGADMPPVLSLAVEGGLSIPRANVTGYDLRFQPEPTDWRLRVAELYDKEDLEHWLFEARDENERQGALGIVPEVLVHTRDLTDRVASYLQRSERPDRVLRVRLTAGHERDVPSLFNVLQTVEVSASGLPTLMGTVEPPAFREQFALLAQLTSEGRVIEVMHYSAWLRVGDAGDLQDAWAESQRWVQELTGKVAADKNHSHEIPAT